MRNQMSKLKISVCQIRNNFLLDFSANTYEFLYHNFWSGLPQQESVNEHSFLYGRKNFMKVV